MRSKQSGFSLAELMIVLLIVAILAAIAISSYKKHFVRASRIDAQSQMMDIANRQEQLLLADHAYVDKAALEATGYSLPAKIADRYTYTITLGNQIAPSFLITFKPYASQAGDGDLTLNSEGVKTPAEKW